MKKTMKKSTKGFLNNLITYAIVIIAFVFTQMALSKMIPGVTISRSLKGQLIPICVYIVMAVSLNLTVGISGELSLGHAGFMSVGAFSGIIMSGWLLNAFQMENETMRLVLAMLAVTLTMAPLNGCRRWIRFGGFTLQSSEVAKFEMILLCSSLAAKAPQVEKLSPGKMVIMNFREWLHVRVWKQLVIPVLPLIPVIALLALEPHMSGIVLTVAVVGTILLLSGSGGILTWVGAGTAGLMLETLLSHVDSIPYLQDRLDGWTQDLSKMTDQTVQSLYAIGSGGLTGLGLGNSVEKQLWLPESTNDFIFSVVCEELGFVGAVLIIVLFVLFIVQGLWIAYRAENLYCTMVGIGIMAQIAWQVFCNIAVVTNTLPNTGISLPFFSSGGTSLILLLAEMGVMVNIGRNGERAAQQREALRAQHEAAKAEQEAARREKTIVLADARAARAEQ